MLQAVVVASVTLAGKTKGLLGNVNGVASDDLVSRSTGTSIASTSTEERIYNEFGTTCKEPSPNFVFV